MILPAKWDPFFRDIEKLFEDFWPSTRLPVFSTDVYETDDKVVIETELPGVKKDEVKIAYQDGYVKIEAKKSEEKEEKKKNYYRKEIRRGSYIRTIPVPEYVDVNKTKANLRDGVLIIELPKTSETKEKGIEIKID